MSRFQWNDSMSVGSELIDSDHRALIDLINRVGESACDTADPVDCAEILDSLIAYVEYHFAREEKMMEAAGYPEVEHHRAEHAGFTNHAYQLRREFDLDATAIDTAALSVYLRNWLNHHILIQDMQYKPCFTNAPEVDAVGRAFGPGLSERAP